MNTDLLKLLTVSVAALCCNQSFANTSSPQPSSNVFQIAQSKVSGIFHSDCPRRTLFHWRDRYILHSQKDVDNFANYPKCHVVPYLYISGEDITNLQGLKYIKEINSRSSDNFDGLRIAPISRGKTSYSNDSLKSLAGLDGLISVTGIVEIANNEALERIDALNNVKSVNGSVNISSNPRLVTAKVFNNIQYASDVEITNNPKLTTFNNSFQHLSKIGAGDLTLESSYMPNFTRLNKIGGSLHLGYLPYSDLEDLGLYSLKTIGGEIGIYENYQLKTLKGLEGINDIRLDPETSFYQNNIYFINDWRLTDCSELSHLYNPKQIKRYVFDKNTPESCKTTLENKSFN